MAGSRGSLAKGRELVGKLIYRLRREQPESLWASNNRREIMRMETG